MNPSRALVVTLAAFAFSSAAARAGQIDAPDVNDNAPFGDKGVGSDNPTNHFARQDSGAAACSERHAFDAAGKPSDYQHFHYWAGSQGDTYLCFFGDKYVHAGGSLSDVKDTGQELIVTIAGAADGQASVYSIDQAALKSRKSSVSAADINNVAWLAQRTDSWRVNLDASPNERVDKVIGMLANISTDKSGLFGGPSAVDHRTTLKTCLQKAVKNDSGAADPYSPPFVSIALNLSDTVRQNGGGVAVYNTKSHDAAVVHWSVPMQGAPELQCTSETSK